VFTLPIRVTSPVWTPRTLEGGKGTEVEVGAEAEAEALYTKMYQAPSDIVIEWCPKNKYAFGPAGGVEIRRQIILYQLQHKLQLQLPNNML